MPLFNMPSRSSVVWNKLTETSLVRPSPRSSKVVAVGTMLALFGRFGLGLCAQLFTEVVARMPLLAGG